MFGKLLFLINGHRRRYDIVDLRGRVVIYHIKNVIASVGSLHVQVRFGHRIHRLNVHHTAVTLRDRIIGGVPSSKLHDIGREDDLRHLVPPPLDPLLCRCRKCQAQSGHHE